MFDIGARYTLRHCCHSSYEGRPTVKPVIAYHVEHVATAEICSITVQFKTIAQERIISSSTVLKFS